MIAKFAEWCTIYIYGFVLLLYFATSDANIWNLLPWWVIMFGWIPIYFALYLFFSFACWSISIGASPPWAAAFDWKVFLQQGPWRIFPPNNE